MPATQPQQTLADRVYHVYLKLTKRLTNRQVMAVLAILVGGLAGIGAYVFNTLDRKSVV